MREQDGLRVGGHQRRGDLPGGRASADAMIDALGALHGKIRGAVG
jgi:hypothetical protein